MIDQDHPEVRRRMTDLLREAGPARRLALARSLTVTCRGLARAGLRRRLPQAEQADLDGTFIALVYGEDLAQRFRAWKRLTAP